MSDDKPARDETDSLYLNTVYPDATAVFAFAPRSLSASMDDALFVLDTNALLVPYGTAPASLVAIRNTYKTLLANNQLVVPGQAAREVAKNRPERLKTMYDQLAKRQSVNIAPAQYPLLAESAQYQTLQTVEHDLAAKLDEYRSALRSVLNQIREWYWDDPVSAMYREMFAGGAVVDVKVDVAELKRDLAFRSTHKVPPGYKDSGKEIGSAGDLLIWRTILELGASRKADVVFVSGEEKSDWWYRTSEGVLYPRYELLDEYRRASAGRSFYILPLADLLEKFGVAADVVEDVREQEAVAAVQGELLESRQLLRRHAQAAVERWAGTQGKATVHGRGHLALERADGTTTPVWVHVISDASVPFPWIRGRFETWIRRGLSLGGPFGLVIVTTDRASAITLGHRLARHCKQMTELTTVATTTIGYIEREEFVSVIRLEGSRPMLEPTP